MLDLALHFNEGPILIKDIARRRGDIREIFGAVIYFPPDGWASSQCPWGQRYAAKGGVTT